MDAGASEDCILTRSVGTIYLAQLDYSPTWIMRDIEELTTALQQL